MRWIIAIFVGLLAAQVAAQEIASGRLTVTGEGGVESVPDMAMITLGVTSQAATAGEALRATSERTAVVLERLAAAGIEPRDMQTRDLSLSPVWDSRSSTQRPGIVGFEAGNTLTVRIRALDRLGEILDDLVAGGANNFRGLSFGLQQPGPALDEARRLAVAEALRKAQLYAEAAGLTLGPILEMSEAGAVASEPIRMERMALSMPVPVAEGEVTTSASVTMVFAIAQ